MRWHGTIIYLLSLSVPVLAKDVTVHGFVTDIKSPTSFAIDDYSITRDNTLALDVSKLEGVQVSTFSPDDIRVGTELEVKGDYDKQSRVLKAQSIKVFSDETQRIKHTALLEEIPALTKKESGWEGEIRADGERLRLHPTTSVTVKANKSESENLAATAGESSPLTSLSVLTLDTFVHYEGMRAPDGEINVTKIEFEHFELEPGAAKLRKNLEPKVRPRIIPGSFPVSSKWVTAFMSGAFSRSFQTRRRRTTS